MCSEYIVENGVIMVAEMLEKSRCFIFMLYKVLFLLYISHLFNMFITYLYIVISILIVFQFAIDFYFHAIWF